MSLLEQHLGRVLTASEVSEYLRCDISSVYRHYQKLGGCKVGTSYKFFERNLIDALSFSKQLPQPERSQDEPISMPSPSKKRRPAPCRKKAEIQSPPASPCNPHGLL